MAEDMSTAGVEASAADDAAGSDGGEAEAGTITEETGGVTADEIAAALGPKYKTVAPAKETAEVTADEEEAATDVVEEDETEEEAEVETPPAKPPKADQEQAASDEKEFAITVKDDDGVTFKINAGDDLDEALADANITKVSQIMSIMRQLDKLEGEKSAYEQQQSETAHQAETDQQIARIQANWDNEIKTLQADKRIPMTAKGADNERVAQVFQFMKEENDKRLNAGRPTIGSFEDALDKLENKEARDAKVEAAKTAKDEARKNGSLVGGSSAPATSGTPVYKAGTARNSQQALRSLGIL